MIINEKMKATRNGNEEHNVRGKMECICGFTTCFSFQNDQVWKERFVYIFQCIFSVFYYRYI